MKGKIIARLAHKGQLDKAGEDYFAGHLTRVAAAVKSPDNPHFYEDVAYLHDVLEDTEVTERDLHELGLLAYVIDAVKILTRRDDENYGEFIKRVIMSGNRAAIAIKKADVDDHLRDTSHINDSLKGRYLVARDALNTADHMRAYE